MRYKVCGKITLIVILMNFWTTPVYGEPPTGQPKNLTESGMKYYNEREVQEIVGELSEAAEEAIEKAAAEAAKAVAMASIKAQAEAQRRELEYRDAKSRGIKNAVLASVICLLSGFAFGAGTVLLSGGK